MPLPKPGESQSRDDFIGACMASETMQREFPDQKQRAAVCYRQWGEKALAEHIGKAAKSVDNLGKALSHAS